MKLVVSIGDINGIGLECFFKSLPNFKHFCNLDVFLFGNDKLITKYLNLLNISYEMKSDFIKIYNQNIQLVHIDAKAPIIRFGATNVESGIIAIDSLELATEFVSKNNDAALLTLPITKKSMYLAGWEFPGHTEYLASKFGVENPVMILFNNKMRVALVTIHIPIKEVAHSINAELFENICIAFAKSLKNDFDIGVPKIAVLGLNPHSGENGSIGNEEVEILLPTLNKINMLNHNKFIFFGPFPSDGFFANHSYNKYDGVIAMYHDQGLIPLKMLDYKSGVNYTAGLPIVRVSPDHGSAHAIAGKGIADHNSTLSAINAAFNITNSRIKNIKMQANTSIYH